MKTALFFIGLLVGISIGFWLAVIGEVNLERTAVQKKIIKLCGKLYRIEEIK